MKRRLHYRVATFALNSEGKRSWGLGFRVGYWPCVEGPFFQLGFGFKRISVWWGAKEEI